MNDEVAGLPVNSNKRVVMSIYTQIDQMYHHILGMSQEVGEVKGGQRALHEFIVQHMEEEENRIKAIHRWLTALTLIVAAQGFNIPMQTIWSAILSYFT